MGTRPGIAIEVTDRARLQFKLCSHFSFPRFLRLFPAPFPRLSNILPFQNHERIKFKACQNLLPILKTY